MPRVSTLILSFFASIIAASATTVDITWPTTHASPAVKLPAQQAEWLPAFRAALVLLPESAIVSTALANPQILGLAVEDSRQLGPLVAAQYELIANDAELSAARSHLSYCYSAVRPTQGLARLSYPPKTSAATPVIVFLHGYGGSFLWYHRWIRSAFPDHIILSPAYGTNPASIPPYYLRECQEQAARVLGHRTATPALIGLSAGGFGAARVYATTPTSYQPVLVLAAYPPPEILNVSGDRLDFRFLAGGAEHYIRDGTWAQALGRLRERGAKIAGQTIPDAGHFFLLTHEAESRKWLSAQLPQSQR